MSFKASDRTCGARRVWRDVLEEGLACGSRGIERLMRVDVMRARPRRRGKPQDDGTRSVIADSILDRDVQADRTASKVYRTRNEVRADVFDDIERFHNPRRRHSKPGYIGRWRGGPHSPGVDPAHLGVLRRPRAQRAPE